MRRKGFGIRIHEKKKLWNTIHEKKQKEQKTCFWGPTLEKEEGFQFQTSQRMNGKTGVPGGETH